MAEDWGHDVDSLVEMEREALAAVVLSNFAPGKQFHPNNVVLEARTRAEQAGVTPEQVRNLQDAVATACRWLQNEGYVAEDPALSTGWLRVTSLAAKAPPAPASSTRPRFLDGFEMHHRLAEAVDNYRRGDLDGAVTLAMKAVEVGVREHSGASRTDHGLDLMKKAFMPTGLLADPRLDAAENIGRSSFYQGLVGWWRNLAGHHAWPSSDAQAVAEILLTANYAIRTVEQADRDRSAGWPTI